MEARVKKLALTGGILLLAFALLAFLYLRAGFAIPCVFHHITGLHCPGCGTMRALVSLTQLRFAQAVRYNAFLLILLPVLAAKAVQVSVVYLRRGAAPTDSRQERVWWVVLLVLFLLFGVLRNLPFFSFFAPS